MDLILLALLEQIASCSNDFFIFQDTLGMDCFSQLKVISKPLNILESKLAFGESRLQEKMCCLKTAASGWKVKKALLQADGLILRANHLEDVSLGR